MATTRHQLKPSVRRPFAIVKATSPMEARLRTIYRVDGPLRSARGAAPFGAVAGSFMPGVCLISGPQRRAFGPRAYLSGTYRGRSGTPPKRRTRHAISRRQGGSSPSQRPADIAKKMIPAIRSQLKPYSSRKDACCHAMKPAKQAHMRMNKTGSRLAFSTPLGAVCLWSGVVMQAVCPRPRPIEGVQSEWAADPEPTECLSVVQR